MGTGGKANCLCLRGIWETPKPRYREETKPVARLPGTTFVPKIHPARPCRGDVVRGTETAGLRAERGDSTCAERHERVSRGVSAPWCVFGHLRGSLCAERLSRPRSFAR